MEAKKNRKYNDQKKKDKQLSTKHNIEQYALRDTNLNKLRLNSGALYWHTVCMCTL